MIKGFFAIFLLINISTIHSAKAKLPLIYKLSKNQICVFTQSDSIRSCDLNGKCAPNDACSDVLKKSHPRKSKSLGFYISGKIREIKKNSIVVDLDDGLPSIYMPKRLIDSKNHKVGAKIWREVSEKEIIQLAKVKQGGGSR